MKINFEQVLPITLVRMTQHCQHFEFFLDSTGCGPLVAGIEAHKSSEVD